MSNKPESPKSATPKRDETSPANNKDAAKVDVPSPESVAGNASWGELNEPQKAMTAAEKLSPEIFGPLAKKLSGPRKKFTLSQSSAARSITHLHDGLEATYGLCQSVRDRPEILVAIALAEKITFNKRSLETGFLLGVKLAMNLKGNEDDRKTASFYARAMNYAAACDMGPAEFGQALKEHGVKALADLEAQRQKLRKAKAAEIPTPEDPIEQFLARHEPVAPIDGVVLPEEIEKQGLALLMVGTRNGKAEAYAFDTDPKRLLAAVRSANKRCTTEASESEDSETEESEITEEVLAAE
ncbi:hypothetical protein [Pelagibius marinus]|uniref:hypothetical protein n=1 Tax=Pelagibius marinus TaxID=2762760 RepID=UPI0018728BBB|nr:hypothetical protein [Pelagibius marinus]